METSFNYTDKEKGFFSSDERRFINKVRKLQEKYPEQVRIIAEPENNDGCIYCQLPSEWLKIVPKRVLTEEHKQKLIANGKPFRGKHQNTRLTTVKNDQTPVSDIEDE